MHDQELNRLIREATRRKDRLDSLDWDSLMFGKQRDFIQDPSRLKIACCGRRAGKSHGVALALLKAGFEHPGSFPIYVNMNRASAKVIIWPALRDIDEQLNLGLKFNQVNSHIKLPNGSEIQIYGAGSRREMDKIRGGKPPIACLDEAQNMGSDMSYLISQVLLPSTVDYKAPILITGTPSATFDTPFYNIIHGRGMTEESRNLQWSTHTWTMADNPHIKDVEEEYDLACQANGWNRNSPGFRREYLGEWIRDSIGRCYHLQSSMLVDRFPKELTDDWRFILGVDLGTVDPCAFTVLAYSRSLAQTYVIESYRDDFSTLQAGTEINRLKEVYPILGPAIVDSGGQGAAFVRQWKDSHPSLAVRPVKKGYNSVDMGISLINADARAGKLFICKNGCEQLLDEMRILVWDDKRSISGARSVRRGDSYPDHCADSFRYAYQKVRTYNTKGFGYEDMLDKGSPEWIQREARKRRQEYLKDSGKRLPFWQQLMKK